MLGRVRSNDRSLEGELRRHLALSIEMRFRRVAINEEQIAAYNLPTKPRKEKDKRSPHVAATVEAEAMPAHALRALLREKIERYCPRMRSRWRR
jgi:hypothetical protein